MNVPPPQPPPHRPQQISFPPIIKRPDTIRTVKPLVTYNIPMDKARSVTSDDSCYYIPPGSTADPTILVCPSSPTTPFEFPFQLAEGAYGDFGVPDSGPRENILDSVTHVVGLPRVCVLAMNHNVDVTVQPASSSPSLMDGGANICLTGILDLLVDVESIPPLPILVATKTGVVSLDDCCTKRGLLPLTLADGSVYYQPCYYCKNAVETIISPHAILASSDVLVQWTQRGHKDGRSGMIRFDSASGLYTISISLEFRDGLYYCPTDVFTVDRDPVRCHIPVIWRISISHAAPTLNKHTPR